MGGPDLTALVYEGRRGLARERRSRLGLHRSEHARAAMMVPRVGHHSPSWRLGRNGGTVNLPTRPVTIDDLRQGLDSGDLREGRNLEFKRQFPDNRALARQIAAFAAEGGALVIGVAEERCTRCRPGAT